MLCAANCISKLGDRKTAQKIFHEAGKLFEIKANSASESIRELVWALRQSYQNFIMSGDLQKAEEIYQMIISYASRINPLFGSQEVRQMQGEILFESMKYDSAESVADIGSRPRLCATIQEFMSRRSQKAGHREVK